jgi:hypothetical protein
MRMLLTDAHVRLLRAMRAAIRSDRWFEPWLDGSGGPSLVIEDFTSEPWASLTFSGMRHAIDIRLSGPHADVEAAYDRLRALMTEPDIPIPGHFLAEMELVHTEAGLGPDGTMVMELRYEALTIED